MKAPNLKDLTNVRPEDAFTKKVEAVQAEAAEMKKKTFSLSQFHLDHINELAVKMTTERGKSVSASEALRSIIENNMKG